MDLVPGEGMARGRLDGTRDSSPLDADAGRCHGIDQRLVGALFPRISDVLALDFAGSLERGFERPRCS
jgi:hypothetical protein